MHVKDFLLWKTTQVFSYFSQGTPLVVLGYLSHLLFFSCVISILLPQLIKLISLLHLDGWFTINESPSSIVRSVILLVTNPKSSSAVLQWSMQEFYLPPSEKLCRLGKILFNVVPLYLCNENTTRCSIGSDLCHQHHKKAWNSPKHFFKTNYLFVLQTSLNKLIVGTIVKRSSNSSVTIWNPREINYEVHC